MNMDCMRAKSVHAVSANSVREEEKEGERDTRERGMREKGVGEECTCVHAVWSQSLMVGVGVGVYVCVWSLIELYVCAILSLWLGLDISLQVPILCTNITFLMFRPVVIITMLVSERGEGGEKASKCVIEKRINVRDMSHREKENSLFNKLLSFTKTIFCCCCCFVFFTIQLKVLSTPFQYWHIYQWQHFAQQNKRRQKDKKTWA